MTEMNEWLFEENRIHPELYKLILQGNIERTVSIRAGISWPGTDRPGYYVFVAQLKQTPEDEELKRWRFLAICEGQENLMANFMQRLALECNRRRVNGIYHGSSTEEMSFSNQLWEHLQKKKTDRHEIIQHPEISKSWRSDKPDFLISLVRDYIAQKKIIFFNHSHNRTPLLLEKVRSANRDADILKIPELKALAYVIDDFDSSPWRPPEAVKKGNSSPWAK